MTEPVIPVNAPTLSPEEVHANHKKRNRILTWMLFLLVLAALISFCVWLLFFRGFESTDDAYVTGNIVVLNARENGAVIAYHAENTSLVKEGDLLVQLDPTDNLANFEQNKVALAQAARQVRGLYEKVQESKANLNVEQAKYEKASLDFVNRGGLVEIEAIAREDFDHSEADFKVAKASVDLAEHQLEAAIVELGTTELTDHPTLQNAKIGLLISYLNLKRCNIYAPTTGYIANRNVQVGQTIQPTTALMDIVPLNSLWVEANFKETQLRNMRIGQPVTLSADMYGDGIKYHGKIIGLQPGSGSTFSLLPAQNATGNWIKIVQRVPVRVSLDPEEVKKHPLVLGLTMYVSVDISNTDGPVLAEQPEQKTVLTNVFDINLGEATQLINEIIEANLQIEKK